MRISSNFPRLCEQPGHAHLGWLVFVFILCLCAPAQGATRLSDVQAASIYALAYGQYGGALPERAPVIHLVSASRLRELMGCKQCPVRGMHDRGVIYLDELLDLERAYDASILLHEYVHYLQWIQGGDVSSCEVWLERERQAYLIQARILERVGENPMPVIRNMHMLRC